MVRHLAHKTDVALEARVDCRTSVLAGLDVPTAIALDGQMRHLPGLLRAKPIFGQGGGDPRMSKRMSEVSASQRSTNTMCLSDACETTEDMNGKIICGGRLTG